MKRYDCGKHIVEIEHDQKILFPKSGITKDDLATYYCAIAPYMLPFIVNRQLSMQRFPQGIDEEGFYHKDAPSYFPSWIKRSCSTKKDKTETCFVVANNAETLVYLASQDAIVLHIGLSKIDKIEQPDRIVFDLDPSNDDFSKVIKAAHITRAFLEDELNLKTFVMTTGSRGVHVVVPIKRLYTFDVIKPFTKALAQILSERHPELLTIEFSKANRGKRVFIDYLRNEHGATCVAPYTVRARENAPVAAPITWEELKAPLRPDTFTIKTMLKRLGDNPWEGIEKEAVSITKAMTKVMKG